MRPTGIVRAGVAAFTIVMSGCSGDGTNTTPPDRPGARPGAVGSGGAGARMASDEDFVRDVAMKNIAAIEFSRIAQQNATNPAITSFARQLVEDHSAAATALRNVAAGKVAEWPAHLDGELKETSVALTQTQGADFEREYLKAMVAVHQDLAAKLESRIDVQSLADWKTAAAARTQSRAMPEPTTALRDVAVRPDKSGHESTMKINQWAADTYPVAQKHLDTARALESRGRDGGVGRQP